MATPGLDRLSGAGSRDRSCHWPEQIQKAQGQPKAREDMMIGTPMQIELAEQIRALAGAKFDRTANALRAIAEKQRDRDRADTRIVITILEDKRAEIMAKDWDYFISEWRELGDPVRQM